MTNKLKLIFTIIFIVFFQTHQETWETLSFPVEYLHLEDVKAKASKEITVFSMKIINNQFAINLKNFANIKQIIVTNDVLLNDKGYSCHPEAKLCEYHSSFNDKSQITNISNNCYSSLFLVVYSESPTALASFEIKFTLLEKKPCIPMNLSLNEVCAAIEPSKCSTNKNCSKVECGNITNNKFVTQSEVCASSEFTDQEYLYLCNGIGGVTAFNKIIPIENETDYFGNLVIIVAISIFALFSLMVICYNVYLIKTDKILFTPPSYFPEFLFPPGSSKNDKNVRLFETNDYN